MCAQLAEIGDAGYPKLCCPPPVSNKLTSWTCLVANKIIHTIFGLDQASRLSYWLLTRLPMPTCRTCQNKMCYLPNVAKPAWLLTGQPVNTAYSRCISMINSCLTIFHKPNLFIRSSHTWREQIYIKVDSAKLLTICYRILDFHQYCPDGLLIRKFNVNW